jgi:hypothetical protein
MKESPNQPLLPLFADHDSDVPKCESDPENIGRNASSIDAAVCRPVPPFGARKGQEKGNVSE